MLLQVVDLGGVGPKASHQGRSARTAERELAISPLKNRAAGSEPVDVGSLDDFIAVAPEMTVQVIGSKEKNVEAFGLRCLRCLCAAELA